MSIFRKILFLTVFSPAVMAAPLCVTQDQEVTIGVADWAKHFNTTTRRYEVDASLCKTVTIDPFSSLKSPLPENSPRVDKNERNRLKFSYPIAFFLGDSLISVKGFGKKDFLSIPYIESDPSAPFNNFDRKPLVSFKHLIADKHAQLNLDYLRFQYNHGFDGKSDDYPIMQSLFVQNLVSSTFTDLELIGSSSVIQIDSSRDVVLERLGIVCDYYCLSLAASVTTLKNSNIEQDYSTKNTRRTGSNLYRNASDQHGTISVNSPKRIDNNNTNSLTVMQSTFVIKTGVGFAVNSVTDTQNTISKSEVSVKGSLFIIDKVNEASHTGLWKKANEYSYGWTLLHPNYGKLKIDISNNNQVNYKKADGKINYMYGSALNNSTIVSHNNLNEVVHYYAMAAYTPSDYALNIKLKSRDQNYFFSTVCVVQGCVESVSRIVYDKLKKLAPTEPGGIYNKDEYDLCVKVAGSYYGLLKDFESICSNNERNNRVLAEKRVFNLTE